MDTPSRRKRRNRLVGRAAATTRRAPNPAPAPAPGDQVLADARDIVAQAWLQVLIEHRDLRLAEAHAADARCDTARRVLAAALLGRQPDQIAAAHAGLEEVLSTARAAHRLHANAHQGLAQELDRLTWRSIGRTVDACIARGGPATPDSPGRRSAEPAEPTPTPVHWTRRLTAWAFRVAASLNAGPRSS